MKYRIKFKVKIKRVEGGKISLSLKDVADRK